MITMKFPRTPHLPGSKATEDDIFNTFDKELIETGEFVATEKMDGSNITMDAFGAYSRSGSTPKDDWFYPARMLHANIAHNIDNGITIAGELLTWRKSIAYDNLTSDFIMFSVMDGSTVLSWDEVVEYAELLELEIVRTIARGSFDEVVESAKKTLYNAGDTMEGFVVRNVDGFDIANYGDNVCKFVGEWHNPVATNNGRNGFL